MNNDQENQLVKVRTLLTYGSWDVVGASWQWVVVAYFPMAPLRLRHPKGVTTIQIDLERDDTKVEDLQQAIFAATEIPPPLQDR